MRPGYGAEPGPGYERYGDYLVDPEERAAAEEAFSERSEGSRARDRLSRAPIELDREYWEEHQRGLDYPGVDTPTDEPRDSVPDMWWAVNTEYRSDGWDVAVEPEEPDPMFGSLALGIVARDAGRPPDDPVSRLRDAFKL